MSKDFTLYSNGRMITQPVHPYNTLGQLRELGYNKIREWYLDPDTHSVRIRLDRYSDPTSLPDDTTMESIWSLLDDPVISIVKITPRLNLPKGFPRDMKRYILNQLDYPEDWDACEESPEFEGICDDMFWYNKLLLTGLKPETIEKHKLRLSYKSFYADIKEDRDFLARLLKNQ